MIDKKKIFIDNILIQDYIENTNQGDSEAIVLVRKRMKNP